MTPSATKVLHAIGRGEATFDELLTRVRPMSNAGLIGAVYELDRAGLIYMPDPGGHATLTAEGIAALTGIQERPDA